MTIIIFNSCKDHITEDDLYDKGKLVKKKFKSNNKIDSIYFYFSDANKIEHKLFYNNKNVNFITYYRKGSIMCKGTLKNNKPIEKIIFYNENGEKTKILDYKMICNNLYLNQVMIFNDGNISTDFSNYYQIIIPKNEIKINEYLEIKYYYDRALNRNSLISLYIGDNIDADYCNVNTKSSLFCSTYGDTLISKIVFSSKGNKVLRGYIKEVDSSNVKLTTRKVYYEIPIKVF